MIERVNMTRRFVCTNIDTQCTLNINFAGGYDEIKL